MYTKKAMNKLNINATVKNKTYKPSCKLATFFPYFFFFFFFEPHSHFIPDPAGMNNM